MPTIDFDAALLAYTTLWARATTIASQGGNFTMEAEGGSSSNMAGSLAVTLLFVPFGIYFGVVVVIFLLECYQFVIVWNVVSRTRNHTGGIPSTIFRAREIWNSRYHPDLDDDVRDAKEEDNSQHDEQQIQECLVISTFESSKDGNNNCPICLSDFKRHEKVATIRQCHCASSSSLYHHDCLTHWLKERPSCPYCRVELFLPQQPQSLPHSNPYDTSSPITDSLEIASLRVEHYLCNAVSVFGEFVSSYAY